MRILLILTCVALVLPLTAAAITAPAVEPNPVFNGDFEFHAPGGAAVLAGTPADQSYGIGHQILGCGELAALIWETDCAGNDVAREDAAAALANDPESEIAYWSSDKIENGDLAVVNAAQSNAWHAANWGHYPFGSVIFGATSEDILDRAATIATTGSHLWQTGLVTSTHSVPPMGLVESVTFDLEGGTLGGAFNFVLDSFPFESVADYPQMFYNYQLYVPADAWTMDDDGEVTIDPVRGRLTGPYAGAYIDDSIDAHPSVAEWNSATAEERREILMEFRAIQISFWNLPVGAVIDNVAMNLDA